MPSRTGSGTYANTLPVFNAKWLLLLGVAGASFIAVDAGLPGAGVAMAAAVALWWAVDTGAIPYITANVRKLLKEVNGE